MTQQFAVMWGQLPPKMKRAVAHGKDRLKCLCGHLFLAHASTVEGGTFVGIGLGSCGGGPLQDACGQACPAFHLDTKDQVPTCTRPEHGLMEPVAPRAAEQARLGLWYSCRADRCTTVVLVPSTFMVELFEARAVEQEARSGPVVEGFYADVVRGSRTVLLAGPFPSEPEAREVLDRARTLANELDEDTHFDAFGTTRVQAAVLPKGKLNERLGLTL